MSESITLSGFTPTTFDFIAKRVEDGYGHPAGSFVRPGVIPVESAADLWFRLRRVPDAEFPGGKWATLQHLESLIDAALGPHQEPPASLVTAADLRKLMPGNRGMRHRDPEDEWPVPHQEPPA